MRRFLLEHVVGDRNSRNTQASYRDALALLLPFAARKCGGQSTCWRSNACLPRSYVVSRASGGRAPLLDHDAESAARGDPRLRPLRGTRSPEHLEWCGGLTAIPFKKAAKGTLPYLEKPEMDAVLAAPDRRTSQGVRDHALLLFLYNAGARADEAARLRVADLDLGPTLAVRILGKGNKARLCPLWVSTASTLRTLIADRSGQDPVFLNRRREGITRFGIYALVTRYAAQAAQRMPSIGTKRVSPHVIRHTTAVHVLRAGVDINTIRAWLGHVSLDTTNIYAEVDLEMKAKALSQCAIPDAPRRSWHRQPGLMAFLKSL